MLEKLLTIDQEILFFFNGLHTTWLDQAMFYLSKTATSIPLYALLVYLIFKFYRKDSWLVFLSIALCVLLADQITSGFMKPFFERLRPTHNPDIKDLIHTVNGYRGGKYGFASSHAANTFAVAMLIWFLFKQHVSGISWVFAWAVLISSTRIYLGVHYPSDILVGALVGVICGCISFKLFSFLIKKINKQKNLG
jgi:undecaprenyl-diphosphatase